MKWIRNQSLYLAWLISFVGVILSFYFGEIVGLEPCNLCWYQRMCLFPLAVILGIAAYRKDQTIVIYALPLSIFGFIVALYQTLQPYIPLLQRGSVCGTDESCLEPIFCIFGFLSFPFLSAFGFLLITILLFLCPKKRFNPFF